MSGVAALLRFPLPGVDDIEEEDIDIDDLINQEEDEDNDGEEVKEGEKKKQKPEWDQEQLHKLLLEVGDTENDEGEEEDNS